MVERDESVDAGTDETYTGKASGPRAGFGRRLVAALVDSLLLGVVYVIVAVVTRSATASYLVLLLLGIAYTVYFEGSGSGQTVGKKLLNIRVIDFGTGGSLGYGRAFVRYVGRILSSIPLYLGYLWMLWDREKQTWHDKLSNAVVVPTGAYPVSSWPG